SADLLQSSIVLTLTSTNNSLCLAESATLQVNIVPKPEITLPANFPPVCVSSGSVVLTGTISGLSSLGSWAAAGTGSIVQGNSSGIVTATYFLGELDVLAGTVLFSLNSSGGICPAQTSTMEVTIIEAPVVNVTQNFIPVCNNASVAVSGTVTGFTSTGIWSASSATSSPGTFTSSATSLEGYYIPSNADIENGFVILTLSSTDNGVCPPSTAAFTASFIPAPEANFSAFGKTCLNSALSFSSTTQANGTNALKYEWNFGDSTNTSFSTVQNPLKTYTAPGQYLVTLTV